jgi:hypothetical protein
MKTSTRFWTFLAGIAGAAVVAGCGSAQPVSSGAVPGPATTADLPGGQPSSPTAAAPQPASPQPAAPQQWVMPNLVGSNLQAAQDQIQALTGNPIFITFSHDATGQSRLQVLDSNWKVCAQNVGPGTPFTATTRIDFGAVNLAEKCR